MRRLLPFVLIFVLAGCGADATPTTVPAPTAAPTAAPTVAAAPTSAPAPTNAPATAAPTLAPPTNTTAPPPAPTDTTAPAPTDTTAPVAASAAVSVTQFTSYTDALGQLVVVGALKNVGTGRVENLKAVVSAESGGAVVATGEDYLLALVTLAPGEVGGFSVTLQPAPPKDATINIQTQASLYDPQGFNFITPAQGLAVSGTALDKGTQYSGPTLTGKFTNGGTTAADLLAVLVVGYDANGKLLDVAKGGPSLDTLAPGASSPFKVTFNRVGEKIVKTDILLIGNEKK